jgi:hypothetical protein
MPKTNLDIIAQPEADPAVEAPAPAPAPDDFDLSKLGLRAGSSGSRIPDGARRD